MRIAGDLFNANDIVGKSLIARKSVVVFKTPSAASDQRIGYVGKGKTAGVVHSWIQKPDGIWWQFKSGSTYYYIRHAVGIFDISALTQQGVITIEAKNEEERVAQMDWLQKLGYNLNQWDMKVTADLEKGVKKVLIYGGIGLVMYFIVKGEITGMSSVSRNLTKLIK